mgnify:CR=1 FL=1
MTENIIRGYGSRKEKKAYVPKIDPDDLNSRQFARVMDLISEGEIEGFASPSKEGLPQDSPAYITAAKKDIFLDNTPILKSTADSANPSNSDFNYQDIDFDFKVGTSNQTIMDVAREDIGSSNIIGLNNVPITNANGKTSGAIAGAVTRQISDPTVDRVRITLNFPRLEEITDKGDQLGVKVKLRIQVQYNGGGFETVRDDTINGRTRDLYQKDYNIKLKSIFDSSGNRTADIRVLRLTEDSDNQNLVDAFFWNSYSELKLERETFPNSAYTALRFDSKQFGSIPQRAFKIRGIKVRIPALSGASAGADATYSQAANIVTVSLNSHGLAVGDFIVFTPISGGTPGGQYSIISTNFNDNSFEFFVNEAQTVTGNATCKIQGTPLVDPQTGRIVYPANYVFDGTMGFAVWTTCPAFILLDLLVNKRYGFGEHVAPDQSTDAKLYENIDLYSYFNASKFANELVKIGEDADGNDITEPRFSCNASIQNSVDAFTLINSLSGVMRCMPIWSAGGITLSQDKPVDPSYLFNLSNVTEDGFVYSGSDLKTRSTVINVSYLNMDIRDIDYETVGDNVTGPNPDQDDIVRQSKYGVVVKNIKAFACTSRTQARRLGKAMLLSQERETETVSFTTSLDGGIICRNGAVIQIADPLRAGLRRGGRVKAVGSTLTGDPAPINQITIDNQASVGLQTSTLGTNPRLSVILPDGSTESQPVNDWTDGVITVNGSFSQAPNPQTIWMFENENLKPQLFRVINVEEVDGINYKITGLSYVPDKYDAIEKDEELEDRKITILNDPPNPPEESSLTGTERIVDINGKAISKLILSWKPVRGVSEYQVNYKLGNNNFTTVRVDSPDFEIFNSSAGTYTVEVLSFGQTGIISSTAATKTIQTVGKTAPPSDITGLSLEPVNDNDVRLRWNLHPDVDVIHGGQIYVRHNLKQDGTGTFQNSSNLIPALAGNSTFATVPALDGEYILKARDDTGNFSTGEASVILEIPAEVDPLQILTRREDLDNPIFQGTKSSTVELSTDLGSIDLKSTGLFDDIPDFDAMASLDDLGAISPEGFYDFGGTAGGSVLDLGAVYNLELKRHIVSDAFIPINVFDFIPDVDLMSDFDGEQAFDANAELLVRSSQNPSNTSNTGSYSQSGTDEVTININSHNYKVNNFVTCDFTSGTATDGEFQITSITNADQFKIKVTDVVTSNGNVTCGPDFTPFTSFANGRFKGQSFKFRATLTSNNPLQDVKITELGYTASFPRRTEQSTTNIASGAAAKTVTFDNEFFTGTSTFGGTNTLPPSVGITPANMESGDFYQVTNITGTGFTVTFRNSSGTIVDRNFGFTAVGFGKKG